MKLNNVNVQRDWFFGTYEESCEKFRKFYYKELNKALAPYVENNNLKTDFNSLVQVSNILSVYTGETLIICCDGTLLFYTE